MSVDRLARALDEQVRRFARALAGARRGEVAGVHQARVASRRLREILPVAAWAGPGDLAGRARDEVRRVTQLLGPVRELDVTRGYLEDAAARHAWELPVVEHLREGLARDRRERQAAATAALRQESTKQMLRDVRQVVRDLAAAGHTAAWEKRLDRRRRKRAKALGASLDDLGTLYVPTRLHAVRIATKKLRYSLEADRAIRRAALTSDIRTLESAQEALGHLHDLQILQDRLHRAGREAGATRALMAQLRRMSAELEGECRQLHAQVLARAARWRQLAARQAER
ncbi:MAG: CHAD domain-containing protein [Acidobacteria bacterium]|nr:CHAD domain-containing protein [Acidobacteriota bacterium]